MLLERHSVLAQVSLPLNKGALQSELQVEVCKAMLFRRFDSLLYLFDASQLWGLLVVIFVLRCPEGKIEKNWKSHWKQSVGLTAKFEATLLAAASSLTILATNTHTNLSDDDTKCGQTSRRVCRNPDIGLLARLLASQLEAPDASE